MDEHTKSLLQALIDDKQLESVDNDGKWKTVVDFPFTALYLFCHDKLRVKQPTIRIGEVDVPEPLRVAPAKGTEYWVANTIDERFYSPMSWSNHGIDRLLLSRDLVHTSQEAAVAHAKALIAVSGGTV